MNHSRIAQLRQMQQEDPEDPFLLYALALEYQHEEPQHAIRLFQNLMTQHPDYVGTYYQVGKTYEQLAQPQDAIAAYEAGIVISQRVGNHHALRELRAALQLLRDEEEEW
ncbi:hypothetical protein SAMN05421823_111158 [Catalinimonas alkaloidigena]|uniref:Uncharacterized protein n=1 Tax=Catalinimonas alkaloidigena TaxID=1075417 RepID=A0A1G9RJM8_9BACT|nr:hypothetical protein [Catalinimonas alkaloidigena]SDM22635.1 hypothetical protein SAMN05421823_111158 [Catalinimonas alkaloidigena]